MASITAFGVGAQVQEAWVARYDGPSRDSEDGGDDITIDPAGNICVTGYARLNSLRGIDCVTLKYDSSGQLLWDRYYNSSNPNKDEGRYIAADRDSNIYIAGTTDSVDMINAFFVIKYNSLGVQQWVSPYPLPAAIENRLSGLALDSIGNVYICGGIPNLSIPYDFDFITIKYNPDGEMLWDTRYGGLDSLYTEAASIAVDAEGNAYVTGWSEDTDTRFRYATVKYNSLGQEQWAAIYANPDGYSNLPCCLGLDADRNVYVTGLVTFYDETSNYQTLKYDDNGGFLWMREFNPDAPATMIPSRPSAMAVDSSGNAYITGNAFGYMRENYASVKYNTNGEEQWSAFYDGLPSTFNNATDITFDAQGNAYVTGSSVDSPNSNYDYATIKYNTSGQQEWVQRYNGFGHGNDAATAIAVDARNDVIVTGSSQENGQPGNDIVTIKYSQGPEGIDDTHRNMPSRLIFLTAYPNPFNSAITLTYTNVDASVIKIVDIKGSLVKILPLTQAGDGSIAWNGSDDAGRPVSSGVYFAVARGNNSTATIRLVFLK
jgi:uncharacterized delta-60 repeat protein